MGNGVPDRARALSAAQAGILRASSIPTQCDHLVSWTMTFTYGKLDEAFVWLSGTSRSLASHQARRFCQRY